MVACCIVVAAVAIKADFSLYLLVLCMYYLLRVMCDDGGCFFSQGDSGDANRGWQGVWL